MTTEQLEERFAQMDMGRMAVRVYHGALEDSGSRREAFWATVAMMVAMMKSAGSEDDE